MNKKRFSYPCILMWMLFLLLGGCNDSKRPPGSDIASSPEQLNKKASDYIHDALDYARENKGDIGDSIFLLNDSLVRNTYKNNYFGIIWSSKEQWRPIGDSLLNMVQNANLYGLFPEDYHFRQLSNILKKFSDDSLGKSDRLDAALWSRADLMLTDAFLRIVKDVKLGRLPKDSITLRTDSVLSNDFYWRQLNTVKQSGSLSRVLHALEPRQKGYQLLKAALKDFLDSANYRQFTTVPLPGKDMATFKKSLQTRLYEGGFITQDSIPADSLTIANAIKRFQKKENITVDGKAGTGTIRMLNLSDREKFIRIAITMDRYKMLPENMPDRYVWVNLPGYYMQLIEGDSVKLTSKIICGKPATRTPLLTSAIGQLITYPQWTIPTSIIIKEVLPGAKKDPGYFAKKGYSLIDDNGNEVDPYTVTWSKYSKGIPYKVVQGSGDDNALGVLKFNFNNKYAVYLHDTNQRYLFAQTIRALSHGCVRVQAWQQLAYAIIRYDSPDTLKTSPKKDSLNSWLKQKIKRSISIRNKLPLFIRYFTCEGSENGIVFYDDMYGEDKLVREKYFAGK
ncbi:MAG: L,D-transpeptidase family protein [Bacteroidota bacterium]|nr:L,D-transpeptidase family protein [Bacteroidota bacterium]